MKHNLNFHNEYEAEISKENREKALSLFNKMSASKPGLMQKAEVKINDNLEGAVFISIGNMSAFDASTKLVILRFLNSLKPSRIDVNKIVNNLE